MLGSATLLPPTALSPVSCGSPPSSSAMSVLVPPMSKVMRLPAPEHPRAVRRFPRCRPPDRTAPPRRRGESESSMVATPPCDCMMSTRPAIARLAQPLLEPAEIAREHGPHVGVHHGGAEALVLLDLREHLGGERHVGAGQQAREESARRPLVPAVAVGMEIADGDGLRPWPRPACAPRTRPSACPEASRPCRRSACARARRAAGRAARAGREAACAGCSGRPSGPRASRRCRDGRRW